MTAPRLLIANGRVIDPTSGLDAIADLAIEGTRIAAIGPALSRSPADRVIDAAGQIVAPGLIDPHVHLREPGAEHKETIASGTRAAVRGGFTTVCCMPNTTPTIDSPELVRAVRARADETAHCRVYPVAAGTVGRGGEQPTEIGLLAAAGAVGISDDGDAIADAGVMARVLRLVAPTGLAFMQHCQEPALTRGSVMHAGAVATELGLVGWPREAEEIIIERDIRLNHAIGCRYHIQHISSAGSVEIVRRARRAGQPITAEASPHHLLLTHDACRGYDTNAKMNPPVREEADAAAIRQGVADGTITMLATDHAPHAQHEKDEAFEAAPFGIVGLESAVALYARALIDSGLIDWPRLIALLTVEPARLCRLDHLGTLGVSAPADVTIIDPDHAWTLTRAELAGLSCNSPFLGWDLTSRVTTTIVDGEVAYELARSQRA